jgi:hypothetical protein
VNYSIPDADKANVVATQLRLNAFGSGHLGGAVFGMSDGSVRFLNFQWPTSIPLNQANAERTLFSNLTNPKDGASVSVP